MMRGSPTRKRRTVLYLLCLSVLLCVPFPRSVPAAGADAAVDHIVVVWLKDHGNAAQREQVLAASEVLRTIPGVTGLHSGQLLPSQRPIVDSSFDVALIVSFDGRAALDAYLVHPEHVRLVEQTLKPLVSRIQVYDVVRR